MSLTKFKYEITNSTTGFVFDLTNVSDPDFVITETREKGKMYFTKKIKNKLIITGSDYTYFINNTGNCYKYWCKVFKRCSDGEWYQVCLAFFSDKNMQIDLDRCSIDLDLQDSSPYNCFNEKRSVKFDIYGGSQAANLFLYVGPTKWRSMYWGTAVLQVTSFMSCCDDTGCYFNLISDFFDWQDDGFGGTLFPDDQTLTNYVNVGQPNYYLRIIEKSDALNPSASNPATKLMLSFDDIEKVMQEFFNVFWVIENDKIRWEHYSWFSNTMNYDSISVTNFPLNKSKNKVKFNFDDLIESETFESLDNNGADFKGEPILYNPDCANGKKINRGFKQVSTDTEYMIYNSSSCVNEGFVLVDCYKVNATPEWYVYSTNGYISSASQKNGRLSWANLHYDLHRHGRPFITGTMNGNPETFLSKIPDIIQEDILTKECCTDDYEKYNSSVRTEIGDGVIDEAEFNYTKEQIKFKLRHNALP